MRVPVAVGVNVTPTVHVPPAPSVDPTPPQVLLAIPKSPAVEMPLKVSVVVWLLVSVTVCGAEVWPRDTLPNAMLVGETVTAATPLPASLLVCGLLEALSVTDNVPLLVPVEVGVNVTLIVQLAPFASVFGLSGHVPPLCANWPVTLICVMVKVAVLTFCNFAVIVPLVVPTTCLPNEMLAGESVTEVTALADVVNIATRPKRMKTLPGTRL